MKNKGFTLVELMAVIIILGIIGFISVPAFINSIKSNNIDSYNNIVNDIVLSAETYASNVGGSLVHIGVTALQDAGYLKKNIINPVTDEPMNGCVYMVSGKTIYKEEKCSTYIMGLGADNVCNYPIGTVWNYTYDPDKPYYTFNTPCSGTYKVELWGAAGGGTTVNPGGGGAYTKGNIGLNRNTNLYIYVGGVGPSNSTQTNIGGYNGGGYSGNHTASNSYGGGGSTDIRLENGLWNNFDSLKSRIMVAGGGGGNASTTSYNKVAGAAGGLVGYDGVSTYSGSSSPTGATQISGGIGMSKESGSTEPIDSSGFFGYATQANIAGWGGGGGSGYFGGAKGWGFPGSGGSSYISGHTGSIAITKDSTEDNVNQRTSNGNQCTPGTTDIVCSYHYSDYIFTDTVMIDGNGYNWTTGKGEYVGQTNPDSTSGVGHTGSGYARVTLVSTIAPQSNDITVRFDANEGVVSTVSKKVKLGGTYGNLPIPTREGYTFKGWNGINIIDIENHNVSYTNKQYLDELTDYILKSNTTYTLSFDYVVNSASNSIGVGIGYGESGYQKDIINKSNYSGIGRKVVTFTTPTTFLYDLPYFAIRFAVMAEKGNVNVDISNIQLEEGTTATAYEPYYIISSTPVVRSNNHTLTALWEEKNATFISGTNFNTRIKQLAGDVNATYETANTSITSIVRSDILTITPKEENIVSTDNSTTPIYAWFDNGTIYYYTEVEHPYTGNFASHMFNNLKNLSNLDISSFDTSKTTKMNYMFQYCIGIETLDLSNFNTTNVTEMSYMFNLNSTSSKLTHIDVSSFDTSNVTKFNYMFYGAASLTELDLSNFDMSKATTATNMLNLRDLSLLKTPKIYPTDSSVKIPLRYTYYDSNNNAYTELDNTSPTNTVLSKIQS